MSFYKYLMAKVKACLDIDDCENCCFNDRDCPFLDMTLTDIQAAHDMYKCEKGDKKNER